MPYRIELDENPHEAIQRVLEEQLTKALADIAAADADADADADVAVHEVRKRIKKVRGLFRLFRSALGDDYARLNRTYREIAGELSARRDAAAILESLTDLETLMADGIKRSVFRQVRAPLEEDHRRLSGENAARVHEVLEGTEVALRAALEEVKAGAFPAADTTVLADGLTKTYRRARRAFQRCDGPSPTAADFHELRKRTKYLRYQCCLLRPVWPTPINAWRKELRRLTSILGDEHDITVLRATLGSEIERFGDPEGLAPLVGALRVRQDALRREAQPLAARLLAEKPKHFARRHRAYLTTSPASFRHSLRQATVERLR
jgi:CHAD domain-containing protein